MNFATFQSNCKYALYGLKHDTVRDFELTCRNPECVSTGHSWAICDEAHCPHYGMIFKNVTAIDAETGKALSKFDNCKIVFGSI